MKNTLALLLSLLVLASCSTNVILDNPGSTAVTFVIDDTPYEVSAGSFMEISLDAGTHKLKLKGQGDSLLGDTTFSLREGGIVHSGASTYLVWRQLYGIQTDRATLLHERWVEFDSAKAFGDIKVYPAQELYLEKNWDHGLNEPLPESKTLMISKDFAVESKVFRADDFLETYRELQKTGN